MDYRAIKSSKKENSFEKIVCFVNRLDKNKKIVC